MPIDIRHTRGFVIWQKFPSGKINLDPIFVHYYKAYIVVDKVFLVSIWPA